MRKLPKRLITQVVFFLLQNPLLQNFFTGRIYQGKFKMVCTPGLNCYSCPAAVTSCPIGAMQLFLAGAKHSFSLFITGFLLSIGVVFGRFICGYVCPMGLLQDLMYKIKTPKLVVKLRYLRYLKYAVLVLFVMILPFALLHELSGLGQPWFCKYICPSGTIFGAVPLLFVNEFLRTFAGVQYMIKATLAAGIVIISVAVYRPFCRTLCPLGAIYALFNKIAFLRMHHEKESCISCSDCTKACKLCLNPAEQPNSPECIRCGSCVSACEIKALRVGTRGVITKD